IPRDFIDLFIFEVVKRDEILGEITEDGYKVLTLTDKEGLLKTLKERKIAPTVSEQIGDMLLLSEAHQNKLQAARRANANITQPWDIEFVVNLRKNLGAEQQEE